MILETTIAFLAGFAVVAAAVSLAVGAAIGLGARGLARRSPAARARLLLAAALAPLGALVAVMTAMTVDPTIFGCHAHRCLHDHGTAWPATASALIAAAGAIGVLVDLGHRSRGGWRARRLEHALARVATERPDGVRVLPLDEPEAFVLGMLRPRIYLSRGLVEHIGGAELRAVLEHERAHVRRRDPLRRAIAAFGLAFHLPGVAAFVRRHLARAQEMAADAEAAPTPHDASETAGALVRLTRLRGTGAATPALASGALAALGDDLEARVLALLAGTPGSPEPRAATLAAAALGLASVALLSAHQIHSGFEALLELLR